MKKIKFLTTLIPTTMYSEVLSKSTNNMQDAANALQWHLYEGLSRNHKHEIQILNILPVGSFPQYYKDAFIGRSDFVTEYCSKNINIGFCNLKLLRKFILPKIIAKELINGFDVSDNGILYVYTISGYFMEAVSRFKKERPKIKVCAIIADLPNMGDLSSNRGMLNKLFSRYSSEKAYKYISCIDSYVLLTKHMVDYLHIEKPYCIVEGIASEFKDLIYNGIGKVDKDKKTVLYTGTLHRKFGVLNLLKAFQRILDEKYELWICGTGDSEKEIASAAVDDNRIKFLGQLTRYDVLKLQVRATVLVNPRQNNEEFTKYSFPSKTMEYLSSGTPVIAYKLDGIPDEYDDYLQYVTNNSIEALANKIVEVCNMDDISRKYIGEKGRNFVINEKTSALQCKKIVDMMSSLESRS